MILRGLAILGRDVADAVTDAALVGMVRVDDIARYAWTIGTDEETRAEESSE